MTYSSGTESDASTDGNVQVVLSKHCSQIADLERRLTYELGKRLELTSLVDTTKSEVAQLKKSLDAEVKARCEGLEAARNLTPQAIDTCDSIGSHKVEPNLNLSTDAFQEVISRERMDRKTADEDIMRTLSSQLKEIESHIVEPNLNLRMDAFQEVINRERMDRKTADEDILRTLCSQLKELESHKVESNLNLSTDAFQEAINRERMDRKTADENILMTVSSQLKEEEAARQKSDYTQLDELNAVIEEHIKNFFAGKSNDDLDQRRGNVVTADHSVHECVVAGTFSWSKPVTVLLTLLAVSFLKWIATAWVSISGGLLSGVR